jgi:peptidoglycan hydrolase-like protein with peptidoglycan-binding domain
MGFLVRVAGLLVALVLGGMAQAQDGPRAWVQIEAQPTLAEAETRARAYGGVFADVAGFRMASGWYAIALGPYTPEGAATRLAGLLADNLVPSDSFVTEGTLFRAPFWPVGTNPAEAPVQGVAPPAPVDVITLPEAGPDVAVITPEPVPGEPVAPPPEPDETLAEARRSEAALSRDELKAIQSALQWFGFYKSAIDGAFGPGTRASMAEWQTAQGLEPTGVLTTKQRALLLGERARIEAELGLVVTTEPEAGIEFPLPSALIEFERYDPPFVQYRAKDGSGISLVLISQPGDETSLFALYDILQTLDIVPLTGPRERGDRSFTIDAADAKIATHAEASLSQGLIKGWMLTWEPAQAATAASVVQTMKAGFKPVGTRALDPGLVALDDAARAGMLAGMEVRRPERSRTGFYVTAAGAVLTVPEAVTGCGRITLDRDTEASVAFSDAALGVALLTPAKPLAPAAVAGLEAGSPRVGSEIAVAGYSYEDALPAPALTFGTVEGTSGLNGEPDLRRLSLAALPGDAGGPVLDASGTVLGMLLPRETGGARQLPEGVSFAAGSPAIAARLTTAGLTLPPAVRDGALAPADLTRRATQMTVLVSCWK